MNFVLVISLALVASATASLPSYFKTCSRVQSDFGACFVENANLVLETLTKGDASLQIPAVAPSLQHPGVKYEPNDDLLFHVKETVVIGLDTIRILDAKADFDAKLITFGFKFNIVDWQGTYFAKALKENDEVTDKSHIMFTDNQYVLTLKFDVVDNHISIVNLTIEYDGKPKIEYKLTNLDKHEAIRGLWEKNHDGFAKVCTDALEQFFSLILGQVFKSATYDEIFPPKQ